MKLTKKMKAWLVKHHNMPATLTDESVYLKRIGELVANQKLSPAELADLLIEEDAEMATEPKDVFSGRGGSIGGGATVKAASSRYSEKRYEATHAKTGETIRDLFTGEPAARPSQLGQAKFGVLVKHLASKQGACQLSEHETQLLHEMAAEDTWAGDLGGEYCSSIKDHKTGHIKALLDSSTSGGIEITPISFDSDVVSTPQLSGELFPFVDRKELSRGRRVEGASIAQIQVVSGEGADASEMALFNTNSLITELNTTIFSVGIAVEVGKDLLSDASVDVGSLVQTEISNSFMAWLDTQIATGDGTSEPEGITVASGTTAVNFSGTTSITNYEELLFSVPKAQRSRSALFAGNETSYQRVRGIPVGASDARRIFGMTHEDYQIFARRYSISEALTNQQIFFGDLGKYRLYMRKGMAISVETGGSYLVRRNLALITARMRVGGRVMLPSSFAVVADAPV